MPPPPAAELQDRLHRVTRMIGVAFGVALALGAALLVLALRPSQEEWVDTQALIDDPNVRRELVGRLANQVIGSWDSHEDPDVSYVSLPNLYERGIGETLVTSNKQGLRERELEVPKPPGVTRVVLLGDSWVFGMGVAAEDRAGARLEEFLRERATGPGPIEVLNVGIPSWNVVAECAYLRRQLELLQPDLVFHVTCPNDLDDTTGVRGMGIYSKFSPQHRERADSLISSFHASRVLGVPGATNLIVGLGYESRVRYERARDRISNLIEELDGIGCGYVMVLNWGFSSPYARRLLVPELDESRLAVLPGEFRTDPENWASESDQHWGPEAGVRVARMLYALIRERDLLAGWELPEWADAERELRAINDVGMEEARRPPDVDGRLTRRPIADSIEFASADVHRLRQVDGGIDADWLVSPYASVLMKSHAGGTLTIAGRALERRELDGAHVRVLVDEIEVGRLELRNGAEVSGSWSLPAELDERPFVSVRLIAGDYVYVGGELRRCAVFRIDRLAIAP